MNQIDAAKKIDSILRTQIETVKTIYMCQKKIFDCVLNRSWHDMEPYTAKSAAATQSFMQLDAQCFSILRKCMPEHREEHFDFFAAIKVFPDQDRNNLRYLYRILRHNLSLSKIENDALESYILHAQSLIEDMVDIAAEESNTSCYTYTGVHTESNYSSVIIDTVF